MRELVVEGQEVLLIPQNFRFVNKGRVVSVTARDFSLELEYEPDGIVKNNFCEFYTQTSHGKLYFDSYAKDINGKTLLIANPAKHKFLQRRQYTRVKYFNDVTLLLNHDTYRVKTVDISAGGMKCTSDKTLDIDASYKVSIPIEFEKHVDCEFQPIRIEKKDGNYTISGQFVYSSGYDKMMLTQYCEKRSVEIKNK
ncbi:PilZ domain-containing protein [bacterium]|nr:PilZ domain-containing protein [bacterium]